MELKLCILLLPWQYAISTEEQIVGMISWTNFPFLVGHTQPCRQGKGQQTIAKSRCPNHSEREEALPGTPACSQAKRRSPS